MLHPSYFGPRMQQYLESKLYSDVEGTCSDQFSFIIAVVSISDIGKGMVISGNGQAEFVTRYRAIVFKPFKGERRWGRTMSPGYVYYKALLMWLLTLSTSHLCRGWPSKLLCLVAGACPLVPSVALHSRGPPSHPGKSPQLLHPDLKFDPSSNPPSYTSQDQVNPPNTLLFHLLSHLSRLQVIENNTKIRIKIIGTRVDATEIVRISSFFVLCQIISFFLSTHHLSPILQFAIGTIKEDHLGVIEKLTLISLLLYFSGLFLVDTS
jgi:DNA-directed RNA polymerase II subunit RPB7